MRLIRPAAIVVIMISAISVPIAVAAEPAADIGRTGPSPAGVAEYVVAFAPDTEGTALGAIGEAGGTVVSLNSAIGVALVVADDAGFLAAVRASGAVTGAGANHSVGTARPGMPHRFAEERPTADDRASVAATARVVGVDPAAVVAGSEPLDSLQWDRASIGATPQGAWRKATGRRVQVGIIDTGIDGSHPDLAPNFNAELSRNFTIDIPDIDGPCEFATCIDPADVDHDGHGTHVAGTVAAARNGFGMAGIAPDAELINLRAGQDSGYFFLYETVAALTYAGDIGLDVVNMSFYTDPWLYNCDSADDYIEGTVTDEELAQQALVRTLVIAALEYAHERGVTLVGSAGNGHTDLSLPTRFDDSSPDYGAPAVERLVTNDCLDLPSEGPHVIAVGATGPTGTKADYSNYGLGSVDIAAPGGWFRDGFGTDAYRTPGNLVLSAYPLAAAIEQGLADENGQPVDEFSVLSCNRSGRVCGFYTYLQGTSMASPHVAGVAALVVERFGLNRNRNESLDPDRVRAILLDSATDRPCPVAGFEDYTDEGRDPVTYNAVCDGTSDVNGLWGEGIVDAAAAVVRR